MQEISENLVHWFSIPFVIIFGLFMAAIFFAELNIWAKRIRDIGYYGWWGIFILVIFSILIQWMSGLDVYLVIFLALLFTPSNFITNKEKVTKIIKWLGSGLIAIFVIVMLAGMYKFTYLANQLGYDADGNKIEKNLTEFSDRIFGIDQGSISESKILGFKNYKNKQLNISVLTPNAWEGDVGMGGSYYIRPKNVTDSDDVAGISIATPTFDFLTDGNSPEDPTIEDYKKMQEAFLIEENIGKDLKVTMEKVTFAEQEGYKVNYTYTSTLDGSQNFSEEYFTVEGDVIYKLIFGGEFEEREKYQNVFDTMKNSYKILSGEKRNLCSGNDEYWYNKKCWKDFEDEGISKTDIDSVVSAQMKTIKNSTFVIDNQTLPLVAFFPIEKDKEMVLIVVYGTTDNYKTLIFPTGKKKIENGTFETPVVLFDGDAISGTMVDEVKLEGTATVNVIDLDKMDTEITGKFSLKNNDATKDFAFKTNESLSGAGNSHIEIKGNEAYLSGVLGTVTYTQIKDLIKHHPGAKTIVLTKVSGSVNDSVNMHTGRLLRENGFTTKVLSDSDIASGGVDLFSAGKKRIVEKGAKIGVHSWCCVNDLTAIEIPKDHPAHQYQLEYFTMTLGPKKGPAFYFYTLEASPFDSVYDMTDDEIKEWNIATEFIENK